MANDMTVDAATGAVTVSVDAGPIKAAAKNNSTVTCVDKTSITVTLGDISEVIPVDGDVTFTNNN